jgi:hypothetical protein
VDKERIIKISKPISKDQNQPNEVELPQQEVITLPQQSELPEQLQELEPERADMMEPERTRFATTNYSGWQASDILREIRLDSFEMGSVD